MYFHICDQPTVLKKLLKCFEGKRAGVKFENGDGFGIQVTCPVLGKTNVLHRMRVRKKKESEREKERKRTIKSKKRE
jgi:hypothetical protein